MSERVVAPRSACGRASAKGSTRPIQSKFMTALLLAAVLWAALLAKGCRGMARESVATRKGAF